MDGIQFLNEENDRLIYLRKNSLSVNILKPYKSWDEFRPKIYEILNIYNEICHPKGIIRIGIRYINNFQNLPENFRIEDYFNYHPKFPNEEQVIIGDLILKSSLPMHFDREIEGYINLILLFSANNLGKDRKKSTILI